METTIKRKLSVALGVAGLLTAQGGYAAATIVYSYDDLNRLTAQLRSDGPQLTYGYDEVGNVTVMSSTNPDTDGDGLTDLDEINLHGTDANNMHSDTDGLTDGEEVLAYSTDPLDADTDNDGAHDGAEVLAGTDPLDPAAFPIVADGDLNQDGVVDVVDVMVATRILNGQLTPTPEQLSHGDVAPWVDGAPAPDGLFNVGDLLVIQRKALGLLP